MPHLLLVRPVGTIVFDEARYNTLLEHSGSTAPGSIHYVPFAEFLDLLECEARFRRRESRLALFCFAFRERDLYLAFRFDRVNGTCLCDVVPSVVPASFRRWVIRKRYVPNVFSLEFGLPMALILARYRLAGWTRIRTPRTTRSATG